MSTLSDLRVETKIVSYIITCTMIIVACFILNNAYAQSRPYRPICNFVIAAISVENKTVLLFSLYFC